MFALLLYAQRLAFCDIFSGHNVKSHTHTVRNFVRTRSRTRSDASFISWVSCFLSRHIILMNQLHNIATIGTFGDTDDSRPISVSLQDNVHSGGSHAPRASHSGSSPREPRNTNREIVAGQFSSAHANEFSSGNLLELLYCPLDDQQLAALVAGLLPSDVDHNVALSSPPEFGLEGTPDVIQIPAQCSHLSEPFSFTPLLHDAPNRILQYGSGCQDIAMVDEDTLVTPSAHLQNTPMMFPTLSTFTPPVPCLPPWPQVDPSQYYHLLSSQASPSSQHVGLYDGPLNNSVPSLGYSQLYDVMNPNICTAAHPDQMYPAPALYEGNGTESQTVPSMHSPMDLTVHVNSGTTGSMHAMMAPGAVTPHFTSTPYDAVVEAQHTPLKRKARNGGGSSAGPSPSSLPGTKGRKRRRVKHAEPQVMKFGSYVAADANATVMAEPLFDPHPVDVSTRPTCGPDGKALRIREYGVMEIDDSYGTRSAAASKVLPEGLTCVRLCDWSDHPCGLYVEMCKDRISNHLYKWHGVSAQTKVPCKFQGCEHTSAMNSLGRHIETVHYSTACQCQYCYQLLSRTDAVTRHQKACKPLGRAKRQAAQEGRKFDLQSTKKVLTGYIVPARDVV